MLKKILLLGVVILGFINISFAGYVLNQSNNWRGRGPYIHCYDDFCENYGYHNFLYNIKNNKVFIKSAGNAPGFFVKYNNKSFFINVASTSAVGSYSSSQMSTHFNNYTFLENYVFTINDYGVHKIGQIAHGNGGKSDFRLALYNDSLLIWTQGYEQSGFVFFASGNDVIATGYDVSNLISSYNLQNLDLSNIGAIDYNTHTKYLQLRTAGNSQVPGYKFYRGGLDKVSLFELLTGSYVFSNKMLLGGAISNIYVDDYTGTNNIKQYLYNSDYQNLQGDLNDFYKLKYDGYIVEYGGQKYYMDKFSNYKTGSKAYNYFYFDVNNFAFYHCYGLQNKPYCDKYDISSYFTTNNVVNEADLNNNLENVGSPSSSSNTTIINNSGDVVIPSNLFDCSNLGGLDCVGKVFGDIGTLFKITITSPINNINNLVNGLQNIKYNTCNTTGQNKIFTGTITTGQNNLLNKVFSQKINLIDYIMNFIIILFVIIWIYFIF